jgi:hypothetical protein
MRVQRSIVFAGIASLLAGSLTIAQVGRGGSQWLTALGDAQRTSWVRTDDKISVAAFSKPGFELQWKAKLDNPPRGPHGLTQGVTAAGVTLFVPMSIVTGSSNKVYAIDNDLGYLVWDRAFDMTLPAPSAECGGGITAGPTRIVRVDGTVAATPGFGGGRGAAGYRSLLGEPGQGVPVEGRVGGAGAGGRGAAPPPAAPAAGAPAGRGAAGAAPPAPPQGGRANQPAERIPGAPREPAGGGGFGFLSRPSGVTYVITSDGMLHVLGLQSGKDLQRPAPFLPANARWSSPIAVDTTLYAATSGGCGGAPHAIWAIDLDSDAKPVVSWKTNGGPVVGAVAFTFDGTLIAAIGSGQASGDGKVNAIVALDAKTLQLKDWFTEPTAEFVTGPTILRHNEKEIVAAATKDGRVLLLDAKSLGGSNHASPLHASKTWLGTSASVAADALGAWQQTSTSPAAATTSWLLLPATGAIGRGGPVKAGEVIAMKLSDTAGTLSLQPGWVSQSLSAPATPITVNGVVFALATGAPSAIRAQGTPAVLHAYDGATGKLLWTSGKAMSTFASPGSLWTGTGQIYVGGHDGTLYAFGFNDERR